MPELLHSAAEVTSPSNLSASSSAHSVAPNTACLEKYIQDIHYQDSYEINTRIFDHGLCHTTPILKSGRCNRILIYPGSFNPPHHGHLELLRHAFQNCGKDMCIVAAIVFPLDDDGLKSKFKNKKDTKIFTKKERVNLWKDKVASDWYWVYDRSVREFSTFRRQIVEQTAKDGFKVEFVGLFGPDYVSIKGAPIGKWPCEKIMVSDISRPADFFGPGMATPKRIEGFKDWKKVDFDIGRLSAKARDDAAMVFVRLSFISSGMLESMREEGTLSEKMDELAEELLQEYVDECTGIWICVSETDPRYTIRFIPAKVSVKPVSSTLIREIIDESPGSELVKALEGLALNNDYLVGYIEGATKDGPKNMEIS